MQRPINARVQLTSRRRLQYCQVVIVTSLVWFLLDVFVLMYFTDCNVPEVPAPDCNTTTTRSPRPGRMKITLRPGTYDITPNSGYIVLNMSEYFLGIILFQIKLKIILFIINKIT